jgi:predicted outer membrane protein
MNSTAPARRAMGTVLVLLGLVATLAALLVPIYFFDGNRSAAVSRSGWQDDGKGIWRTEYGPLTSLDRDFIREVRTAGLWELPAGQAAQERSTRKSVRTVGDHLIDGDKELDKRVVQAGLALKVELPNQPTGSEQKYLDDIGKARDKDFDRILVNHLRNQNGRALTLISLVRDQTRNSMVRSLATRANSIVLDHITVLEDTGLVEYEALREELSMAPHG